MLMIHIKPLCYLVGPGSMCSFDFRLQGLKRNEQHSMLEIFRGRIPVGSSSNNTGDSGTGTTEQESSRIKRLEKLIKKQIL